MESFEQKNVVRAAGIVGFYKLLSRILGLVRDMVVAALLGTGPIADAFIVAFRIPNLLRRLFSEGSLTSSFIPVFSDYLSARPRHEAFELARITLTVFSLILLIITITGIIFSPLIVRLLAPGFEVEGMRYDLTVFLTRITFPYVFLIGIVAFFMGILNSLNRFAAPAAAPIFLNVGIIGAAFLISPHLEEPSVGLAIGILIGGILQLGIQLPWVFKEGVSLFPKWNPKHPAVKKIGLRMFPALFGSAVYQFNQFIGTIIASTLVVGSVSWLYFADRIVQLPLGIFAIAISTAAFPVLSIHASKRNLDEFRKTLSYSLNLTFFIVLPSMGGLLVLGEPIIRIFLERGVFNSYSTIMTRQALFFYSVGLWAFSATRVMSAAFFAVQDTKTPLRIAYLTIALHFFLCMILMDPLKHGGIALALSLSSVIQLVVMAYFITRKIGVKWLMPDVISSAWKSLLAATIMAVIVEFVRVKWLTMDQDLSMPVLTAQLAGLIFIGIICYIVPARIMGCPELSAIRNVFGTRAMK